MNLILTTHAKWRMNERNISINEISQAIEFPDYTIVRDGIIESYKIINNRYLKIVSSKEGKFIKIITVIIIS